MGTVVGLYVGWRLLRLLRPLLGAALVVLAVFALHIGHATLKSSAANELRGGAAAAVRDLPHALERGFQTSRR